MSNGAPRSLILDAVDALKRFDRTGAAQLVARDLQQSPAFGERWRSVGRLCGTIGEISLAIEAARRYAQTQPRTLDRALHYWGELAGYGRASVAINEIDALPSHARKHPGVLHFLGTVAAQEGRFDEAIDHFRLTLRSSEVAPQTWFALAMIKNFEQGDDDIRVMSRLKPLMAKAEPDHYARFLYGLAKAHHDVGDYDLAWQVYCEGAALRRASETYDKIREIEFADLLIRDFTRSAIGSLKPSGASESRAIFVNGFPRSGTTLVEQIFAAHSMVSDGGEVNLLRAALIPAGDCSFAGALKLQSGSGCTNDPWGDIARDYERMLSERFPESRGRIVDKTLNHTPLMGLLLHALPDARVVWLRRRPEDCALSCFRSFFTQPMPWSWSLADIATHFRIEDRLYAHWCGEFGDRILTVPYEELVSSPEEWIPRILDHAGLPFETQTLAPHMQKRTVRTASVAQVRKPISSARIGAAKAYDRQMDEFRKIYYQ